MIEELLSKLDQYLYDKGGFYSFDYTVVGSTYVFVFICEEGETSVDMKKVSKKDLTKFVKDNKDRKINYDLYNDLCSL